MSANEGRRLQAAVEAELTQLLATQGIPDNWQAGGEVPQMPSLSIQVKPRTNPTLMGKKIAQEIYGGMKP